MEFEFSGETYRADSLDGFAQARIAKRLLPLLASIPNDLLRDIGTAIGQSTAPQIEGADAPPPPTLDLSSLLVPISEGLSRLSDEDLEMIFTQCGRVVFRKSAGKWVPVWNRQAGAWQFSDIKLMHMVTFFMQVLGSEFSDFFPAPQGTPAAS